ncbi:UPF0575 protein C19orf67 homolog [Mugil cephalus]|uniref:UPF0575 protein C19orf67 homolog n=1 Tax=Mugil cephalus TaxID=48193 RepID=UPI001FB69B67|nr:UPF0575 protein C19orf67 homolog [Mugil cephalus]
MTDTEVQVEVLLENSPSGPSQSENLQQENVSGRRPDYTENPQNSSRREADEPLLFLADVALAPPCGEHVPCRCLEVRRMEISLQSIQRQLQFLTSKADDLQDCLVNGTHGCVEKESLAAAVLSFLYICQPYFNHLESTARGIVAQHLSAYRHSHNGKGLLDFSQQLCERLEQLLLTCSSYSLCLDEAEPTSVSHFCIGQIHLGQLRLTIFRYCKPMPYLARVDTGLYKRMRWNVERLGRGQPQDDKEQTGQREGREAETGHDTDYYFLCYEDISNPHAEADRDNSGVSSHSKVVRMWSIGQWVQVNPDPDTENISDWIICEVPQATYHRLLFLGREEPSSCSATDCLQQLLLSHLTVD